MPDGTRELWRTYNELSAARGQTGYGGAPITYADLLAYQSVHRVRLTEWEISTIKAIDATWIADQAEQAKSKRVSDADR